MVGIDVVLDDLRPGLPVGALVTDPDVVDVVQHRPGHALPAGAGVRTRTRDVDGRRPARAAVASRHRVPVVPQGARSGLSGAANAIDGSILLNVEKMNRIIEIDVTEPVGRHAAGHLQR